LAAQAIEQAVRKELGPKYRVELEKTPPHLHVEYRDGLKVSNPGDFPTLVQSEILNTAQVRQHSAPHRRPGPDPNRWKQAIVTEAGCVWHFVGTSVTGVPRPHCRTDRRRGCSVAPPRPSGGRLRHDPRADSLAFIRRRQAGAREWPANKCEIPGPW
jgi:hypothetical protein